LFRLPNALLPDPLAGLVDKELRTLARSPRFRLVFLMGFTFGLLIWLPMTFGENRNSGSIVAENYLTFVSVYALMLLAEAIVWNSFGFDRSAAQMYFVLPVPFSSVLLAKNLTTFVLIVLNVSIVVAVCILIRTPITAAKVLEAFSVTLVLSIYLLALGNLASLHKPRGVDPSQSWRSGGAGKFQAMLLLVYPVLLAPILLAYGARYAFETQAAFYGVLFVAAILGAVIYWVALDSALDYADRNRERILTSLSQGENPVG
jgi:ABC-2 type transport system permease protein